MSRFDVRSRKSGGVLTVGLRLSAGAAFGLVAGIAGGWACTPTSGLVEGHCANQDGDDYCKRVHPDRSLPYCARGTCELDALDGCVAERPAQDECYSPCGEHNTEEDLACDAGVDVSSSAGSVSETEATIEPTGEPTTAVSVSATETDTSSSTSPTASGCTLSAECLDAASPICVDMACVPCSGDDECAAKDPAMPACRDDGQCVACTASNTSACVDTTPICDAAASECVGCDFHEQCTGTACDIATGACFSDACVVEVDGDGGADYQDIQDAIVDGCVVIVHERNGGLSYQESLEVDGSTVALLAADGESPIVVGLAGNPSLEVVTGATVYVHGLTLSGNTMAEGISVQGASLYVDRTSVVGNSGGGILLTDNADGHLRNCFVGGNVADVAALEVSDGAAADILYTTVVAASFESGAALRCIDPGEVEVRNSVLVMQGSDAEVQCSEAVLTASATETGIGGTVALGNVMAAWFVSLGGDFHLNNPPVALLTAAQWEVGDPAVDIDGDSRPDAPGPDAAGADIP